MSDNKEADLKSMPDDILISKLIKKELSRNKNFSFFCLSP